MKVVLKLQNQNLISEIPLKANESVTIGRSREADCKVIDQLVSGTHCVLQLKNNKLEVKDLDSKNGTFLNGVRIDVTELYVGDEIQLGATKLTFAQDKMDTTAIQLLSFPGLQKNRISHELKLDFTALNQANPFFYLGGNVKTPAVPKAQKEVSVRKIAQSRIRLSKQEIKKRNQVRSSMASTIDILLCLAVISLPLIIMNILIMIDVQALQEYRLLTLSVSEIIILGFFFFLNFKIMKFTAGEKFSGIERIYQDQD